jgi:hypothetical protein
MPDQGRATAMLAFTDHALGQGGIKDVNGADEGKGGAADINISPAPDRLREMERFPLRAPGDCWPGVEPRQPMKARDRVRRGKRRAHRAAPYLQRRLDWPGRDTADEL